MTGAAGSATGFPCEFQQGDGPICIYRRPPNWIPRVSDFPRGGLVGAEGFEPPTYSV